MYTNLHPRRSPDSSPTLLPAQFALAASAENAQNAAARPLSFQQVANCPICNPFVFKSMQIDGGCTPLPRQSSAPKTQPLRFQYLTHSFARFCTDQKIKFHRIIALRTLCQKHPGWGGTLSPNSAFYLLLSTFPGYLPTGHEPLVTDHSPGKRTVALSPHSTPLPLCGAAPAHTIEIESDAKTASHVRSLANWSRKNNLWVR